MFLAVIQEVPKNNDNFESRIRKPARASIFIAPGWSRRRLPGDQSITLIHRTPAGFNIERLVWFTCWQDLSCPANTKEGISNAWTPGGLSLPWPRAVDSALIPLFCPSDAERYHRARWYKQRWPWIYKGSVSKGKTIPSSGRKLCSC